MTIALCNTIKKVAFFVVFLGLILPYIALGMQNDFAKKDDSLIPFVRLDVGYQSTIVLKKNVLALMNFYEAQVYNLDTLSPVAPEPFHKYIPKVLTHYNCMDLNQQGTEIALSTNRTISIYSFNPLGSFLDPVDPYGKNFLCKYASECTFGEVKFSHENKILVNNRGSVLHWGKDLASDSVSMDTGDADIKSTSYFIGSVNSKKVSVSILETHPETHQYACLVATKEELPYHLIITKCNIKHSYFFLFVLRSLFALPKDVQNEIFLKIEPTKSTQQISLPAIDEAIYTMEYSHDGNTIALAGCKNIYIYEINHSMVNDDNKISKIPFSGWTAFHPNNKTIFVLTRDEPSICGVDIKRQEVIYRHKICEKKIKQFVTEEPKRLLAFNKVGDKLVAAFSSYCQVYDIPKSLQNFLNTYD